MCPFLTMPLRPPPTKDKNSEKKHFILKMYFFLLKNSNILAKSLKLAQCSEKYWFEQQDCLEITQEKNGRVTGTSQNPRALKCGS